MTTRRAHLTAWIGYFAVIAASLYGMTEARAWALRVLDTPEARAEHEVWREAAKKQSETPGPVKRRPVKATEPPMLILLRDNFAAAAVTNLIAVTIFYWFFTFVIRGMFQAKRIHEQPSGAERAVEMIAGSSEKRR